MASSTKFYVTVNGLYFGGFEVGQHKLVCNFYPTRSYSSRGMIEDDAKRYYRLLREIMGPRNSEGDENIFKLIAHTHVDEEVEIPIDS